MADAPHITQNFARPSYRPDAPASGMDPEMRRMALLAAGFGGLVALVVGAFSLSHHVHHGVPVIEAMAGPVRVKPADPGGMKVAGGWIDQSGGAERLDPPAERPEIRALHAEEHLKPAPAAAQAPPASPPVAPASPASAPQASAPQASAPQASPAPEPAAAPAAADSATPAAAGTMVQLAAFESQQAANQEWARLSQKMPAVFSPHKPEIDRATLVGRTVWRLRTGGFANMAAATEFCGQVRAGGGDCSIAAF